MSETKKFDAVRDGRYLNATIANGKDASGCVTNSCVHVRCFQGLMGDWVCPNPHNRDVVAFVSGKYDSGHLVSSKMICVSRSVFNDENMWSDPVPKHQSPNKIDPAFKLAVKNFKQNDSSTADNKSSSSSATTEEKVQAKNDSLIFCRWCDTTAKLRCGRCKRARYCSVECQTKHWPDHKRTCFQGETPVTKSDAAHKEPTVKS